MDQHYSYCEKHDAQWHTMTNGDECPFCKHEKVNDIKLPLCEVPTDFDSELAASLSRYVHLHCRDVPHDIGIHLASIVSRHFAQRVAAHVMPMKTEE